MNLRNPFALPPSQHHVGATVEVTAQAIVRSTADLSLICRWSAAETATVGIASTLASGATQV
ncbi:hypothetical protein GCM10027290_56410 [Micromonospora sonneratiae]|uniref:Uncharacterized protein n=1 Tax=Micromonospora sonneratiae TaxID=1184706 RepID=A0ABW3YDX3_9ACTN